MIATPEDQYQPVRVRNVSGEIIPDDAVMQVTGAVIENGSRLVTVTKPDGSGSVYLINRRNSIPVGRSGSALHGFGKSVLVTGTPSVGDAIGPVSGSWSMGVTGTGFIAVGDVRDSRVRVTPVSDAAAFTCLVVTDFAGATFTENDATAGNSAPTHSPATATAWLIEDNSTFAWPPAVISVEEAATAAVNTDVGTLADGSDTIDSPGDPGYDAARKYGRIGWGVKSGGKYRLLGLDCFVVPYFDYVAAP